MTHRPIRFRTRLVAIGSAVALALAACGDDDDAAGGTIDSVTDTSGVEEPPPVTEQESVDTEPPATEPPATEPPATEPPATEPPATEPPATEPPATEPPATEPPTDGGLSAGDDADASSTTVVVGNDCLVGDWVITNEEMNAYYDAVVAAIGTPGFEIDVTSGSVGLTMTTDTYEYSTDFTIDVQVAGTVGTGTATGSVSGTWSAEAGIITSVTGSSDLDIVIDVAGVTRSGSDFGNGLLIGDPINMAPFDCAGPTIGFETGVDTPRHPVTLTPA